MPAAIDVSKPNFARAAERLERDLIVWISTVRPDGRPHIVPVWFLWDGDAILIFSKPDQKVRNLHASNKVMLALDDTDGGEDVVLLEGEAEMLPAGVVNTTLPAYARKYADKLREMKWTPESMALEYTEAIRITLTKAQAW